MILNLTSHADMSLTGQRFLLSCDCNRKPNSHEIPGANCLSPGTSRVNQGVIQQSLLVFVVFLISPRGIRTRGQPCLQIGLTQFESCIT